ncbi:hypothetical protein [Neomegalonema sp.]|uniref:hypothetical protein n=1 Tax=Neomegalonema sp. TaxID=2039713 RepID=UPI0026392306|nr:hypothetical protein [Neomegalonema sp.]MDD2869659.1 hypothetical protein [Neomegalonema sp.]
MTMYYISEAVQWLVLIMILVYCYKRTEQVESWQDSFYVSKFDYLPFIRMVKDELFKYGNDIGKIRAMLPKDRTEAINRLEKDLSALVNSQNTLVNTIHKLAETLGYKAKFPSLNVPEFIRTKKR